VEQLTVLVLTGFMSSGFVSGGTADQPLERDDEWRKAQQEIEERHRRKEEESRQGGEKSLYEILQNNKGDYQHLLVQSNLFRGLSITDMSGCLRHE